MSLKTIRIAGYRRLHSVDLEMRPLTVLIGPNGTGKTSLLEALFLLAESARGSLQKTLSDFGGLNEVMTRGKADELLFHVTMAVPGHEPLAYSLGLKTKGHGYDLSLERLSQHRDGYEEPFKHIERYGADVRYYDVVAKSLQRPTWDTTPFETSLSQVPKMYHEPEKFRQLLASCTYYSSYRLDLDHQAPIRLPQKMQPASHPGPNGEHLVSYLYYLRETDRLGFEIIEDTLAAAFPGFIRLNFPPVAAGTITMTWQEQHFDHPLFLNQLSEGTLRFLWLITLLQSPNLPAVTMIDEPEVSLHPQLLSILVETMREASQRSRLIVATHSDRLIRFLDPTELVVTDLDKGLTTFTRAEDMDLDKWLADYSMDELWNMGVLGGKS